MATKPLASSDQWRVTTRPTWLLFAIACQAFIEDREMIGAQQRAIKQRGEFRTVPIACNVAFVGRVMTRLDRRSIWLNTQNIPFRFAPSAGTGCITSQCSATLPLSIRKISTTALPRSPGLTITWTWAIT